MRAALRNPSMGMLICLGVACSGKAERAHVPAGQPDSVASADIALWATTDDRSVEELFTIGRVDGDSAYTFAEIYAVDVDPSGRVYILDRGNFQVKSYAADGRFIRSFGRKGGGPGEFRNQFGIVGVSVLTGRRIAVYDFLAQKIAIFNEDGGVDRTLRVDIRRRALHGAPKAFRAVAGGRDGYLIHSVQGYAVPRVRDGEGTETLIHISRDGKTIDTVRHYASRGSIVHYGSRRALLFPQPFAPATHWAVSPTGHLAIGNGTAYEIDVLDASGTETFRLGRKVDRQPITRHDRARFNEVFPWGNGFEGLSPETERAARNAKKKIEYPEYWPVFDELKYDDGDRLWVRQPRSVGKGDMDDSEWEILLPDNRYLGTVRVPGDVQVMVIAGSRVYAKVVDSVGVNYLRVYRIVQGGSDPM